MFGQKKIKKFSDFLLGLFSELVKALFYTVPEKKRPKSSPHKVRVPQKPSISPRMQDRLGVFGSFLDYVASGELPEIPEPASAYVGAMMRAFSLASHNLSGAERTPPATPRANRSFKV